MTAMGFLILIGVVVNNAILVVDGALARLRDGHPLALAVPGAVEARVRPIFMSALTSLAGPGADGRVSRARGRSCIAGSGRSCWAGLALSTVLTLYVVPCLFTLLWRLRGMK